jgi:hypothetical protein
MNGVGAASMVCKAQHYLPRTHQRSVFVAAALPTPAPVAIMEARAGGLHVCHFYMLKHEHTPPPDQELPTAPCFCQNPLISASIQVCLRQRLPRSGAKIKRGQSLRFRSSWWSTAWPSACPYVSARGASNIIRLSAENIWGRYGEPTFFS